jgi:hypothetical protein
MLAMSSSTALAQNSPHWSRRHCALSRRRCRYLHHNQHHELLIWLLVSYSHSSLSLQGAVIWVYLGVFLTVCAPKVKPGQLHPLDHERADLRDLSLSSRPFKIDPFVFCRHDGAAVCGRAADISEQKGVSLENMQKKLVAN